MYSQSFLSTNNPSWRFNDIQRGSIKILSLKIEGLLQSRLRVIPLSLFLTQVFKTRGCPTEEPQKDVHSILKIFPDFDAFKLSPPSSDIKVVQNLNEPWAKERISQSFREEIVEFKQMLRSKLNPKQSFVGEGFLTGGG